MAAGTVSRWRLVWGFVLSIFPGLGHLYARLWRVGLALLAANFLVNAALRWFTRLVAPTKVSFFILIAVLLVSLVVTLGIAIDAARRNRMALERPRSPWFRSTWLVAGVYLAITWLVLPDLGWQTFAGASSSMEPSIRIDDRFMATTAAQPPLTPARGTAVLFDTQGIGRNQGIFIKRVIGLPGDRVALRGGIVQLNGSPVQRTEVGPYTVSDSGFAIAATHWTEKLPGGPTYDVLTMTPRSPLNEMAEVTVPPGRMFVLGDNRDNSLDSRVPDLGMVPIDKIVATGGLLYWTKDRDRMLTPVR